MSLPQLTPARRCSWGGTLLKVPPTLEDEGAIDTDGELTWTPT